MMKEYTWRPQTMARGTEQTDFIISKRGFSGLARYEAASMSISNEKLLREILKLFCVVLL